MCFYFWLFSARFGNFEINMKCNWVLQERWDVRRAGVACVGWAHPSGFFVPMPGWGLGCPWALAFHLWRYVLRPTSLIIHDFGVPWGDEVILMIWIRRPHRNQVPVCCQLSSFRGFDKSNTFRILCSPLFRGWVHLREGAFRVQTLSYVPPWCLSSGSVWGPHGST